MADLEIYHFLDELSPLPLFLFDRLIPLIKTSFHEIAEHVETDIHKGVHFKIIIRIKLMPINIEDNMAHLHIRW